MAHLLKAHLERQGWDTVFEAQILSLVHAGAFVLFNDLYQAFLPARALPGDYYELNEAGTALVGRRTGEAYRLADQLSVQVTGIDEARGRVDAVPAPGEGEDGPPSRPSKNGGRR